MASSSPPSTPFRRLHTTLFCCSTTQATALPSPPPPTLREKGKQPCPRIPTPPGPITSGRCTSPPKPTPVPSPPSPALPPPRKSPSPVASLKMKLGLEESWMSPPAAEGRWWMEPGSRPYFPGRMRKREKKRLKELGVAEGGGAGVGVGKRPVTANSEAGWSTGRVSGTTIGSEGSISGYSIGGGPRKEVPREVKRYLKGKEEAKSSGAGAGGDKIPRPPRVKRERSNSQGQQTQQWVKTTVTDLPPIMGRIDGNSTHGAISTSSPPPMGVVEGLNVIREESPIPVWLAEERSRLLIEQGKCFLKLRKLRKAAEGDGGNVADGLAEKVQEAEKELERIEERLRVVGEKARGLEEGGGTGGWRRGGTGEGA